MEIYLQFDGVRDDVYQSLRGEPLLETFLFDFSGDLYGEDCTVSVVSRLRGEEKFDGLAPLVAQMKRDEDEALSLIYISEPTRPH